MARFLKAGWMRNGRGVLGAALLLVCVAGCVALGLWQLRRAAEKNRQHESAQAAWHSPAWRMTPGEEPAQWIGRRLSVQGVFEPQHTVFLDNRTHQGRAGFWVFTPVRLTDQSQDGVAVPFTHVLVLRGWVARDVRERTHLPDVATPSGRVHVQGLLWELGTQPRVWGGQAAPEAEGRLLQQLDLAAYRSWSGLAVAPAVVRQRTPLQDGLVRAWVEPGSGVDRHRAYAWQWFAMAAACATYAGYGVVRRRRGRMHASASTPPRGNPRET